jgi:hypothetical protein
MKNQPAENGVVNLFMVYSPLHCLAAESIAEFFEKDTRNCIFYLKRGYDELIDPAHWESVQFLPWPRFYPMRGFLGRTRRLMANLQMLAAECEGYSTIRLHSPVIDTEAVNYSINFLKKKFPSARFSVRLLPDGLLNIQRNPLGRFKEIFQYTKKMRRLISPSLNYYIFKGDRTGADSSIVDRIYILPRFPHEYHAGKVVELPPLIQYDANTAETGDEPCALVLGQPLVGFGLMTQGAMERVSQGIRGFIERAGFCRVDYKAHPREKKLEFFQSSYRKIDLSMPFEAFLVKNPYDLVVGISSTALVTARYILPEGCRVVAYGLEEVCFKDEKVRQGIESLFRRLGIEIVMSDNI